ncbi:MAG TPA: molybdate ABC transporter substrate-binding protein [Bacillota bacterium]|nr:molybdate ABC transporter substrate-binding protein [Bacillota bacterium]
MKKWVWKRSLFCIWIVLMVIGPLITTSYGKREVRLIVSAAASLQAPLATIGQLYRKVNPEVKVVVNFGSSGALRQQIEQGAPVDLFFPASTRDMDSLAKNQLILTPTRIDLLKNSMVLIVSPGGAWIKTFRDLISEKLVQIALGKPESVPAGRYAQEIFNYLGIWKQVQAKAVFAKDVKQVLTWVATGNVDAGMVYSTDALDVSGVKIVRVAPENSHSPIIYPVAVVKSSLYPREAKSFLNFLSSAKAKQLFLKFGFLWNKP